MIISFLLIGYRDLSSFGLTTLSRKALLVLSDLFLDLLLCLYYDRLDPNQALNAKRINIKAVSYQLFENTLNDFFSTACC